MKPLKQSSLDDLVALQMENELLVHETRHLRARLKHFEREGSAGSFTEVNRKYATELARADRQYERAERVQGKLKDAREELEAKQARLTEVEGDLRWLIHRLNELPGVGVALRRTEGFHTLLERYPKPS